jgi:hypothetical protein
MGGKGRSDDMLESGAGRTERTKTSEIAMHSTSCVKTLGTTLSLSSDRFNVCYPFTLFLGRNVLVVLVHACEVFGRHHISAN